jgi:hypothetical protein
MTLEHQALIFAVLARRIILHIYMPQNCMNKLRKDSVYTAKDYQYSFSVFFFWL